MKAKCVAPGGQETPHHKAHRYLIIGLQNDWFYLLIQLNSNMEMGKFSASKGRADQSAGVWQLRGDLSPCNQPPFLHPLQTSARN